MSLSTPINDWYNVISVVVIIIIGRYKHGHKREMLHPDQDYTKDYGKKMYHNKPIKKPPQNCAYHLFYPGLLLCLFFYPEDTGDIFLRNDGGFSKTRGSFISEGKGLHATSWLAGCYVENTHAELKQPVQLEVMSEMIRL
jgi:hypothetical protein